jgi:hypothetical protein
MAVTVDEIIRRIAKYGVVGGPDRVKQTGSQVREDFLWGLRPSCEFLVPPVTKHFVRDLLRENIPIGVMPLLRVRGLKGKNLRARRT